MLTKFIVGAFSAALLIPAQSTNPQCKDLERLQITNLPMYLSCTKEIREKQYQKFKQLERENFANRLRGQIDSSKNLKECIEPWSSSYAELRSEPVATVVEAVLGKCESEVRRYIFYSVEPDAPPSERAEQFENIKRRIARLVFESRIEKK